MSSSRCSSRRGPSIFFGRKPRELTPQELEARAHARSTNRALLTEGSAGRKRRESLSSPADLPDRDIAFAFAANGGTSIRGAV